MRTAIVTLLTLVISTTVLLGQSQFLDQSFGTNGYVITDISNLEEDPFRVFVQADGKLVVSGDIETAGEQDFMMLRYNADGTLDNTFANGGVLEMDQAPGEDDVARGVHILPSGKMLVLARAYSASTKYLSVRLMRLNANGTIDSTFGTNGFVQHDRAEFDLNVSELVPLASGKYLTCGFTQDSFSVSDFVLMRFNADGSLDGTFGTNGYVVRDIFTSFDFVREIVELPNGDLMGAGWSYNPNINDNQPIMVKYKANGTPDASFGNNGVMGVTIVGGDDLYRNVALHEGTHFLAAGRVSDPGQDIDVVVSRFDFNGVPDSTFGTNGHFRFDHLGNDDWTDGLLVLPDSKILVSFAAGGLGSDQDFALIKLKADGTRDSSFANDGLFVMDVENDDNVEHLAAQPDGKILIVGNSNSGSAQKDILLMRVTGVASSGFGEPGATLRVAAYPNPASDALKVQVEQAEGEVIQYRLFNAQGQLVSADELAPSGQIAVGAFGRGVYVLTLVTSIESANLKLVLR